LFYGTRLTSVLETVSVFRAEKVLRSFLRGTRGCRSGDFCISAKHEFFSGISLLRKQGPLPAQRFSCLSIQWCAYVNAICKESLWKKKSVILVYRGEIKGSENFFRLILSEKKLIPTKIIHQLSISDVKMLQFTEKMGKHINFVIVFGLHDRRNFRHFVKLGAWRLRLAHAYYVFFSALNVQLL